MKKTFTLLALVAGFVSLPGTARAAIHVLYNAELTIMSNMNNNGVSSSKNDANIWFKLSQPLGGLLNTLVLYGASNQTVSLKLNESSGQFLPQGAYVNGIEDLLGNSKSAYNFAIPSSLQNIAPDVNGTAFTIRDISSSGDGFYAGDDDSITHTVVNPYYAAIITPGLESLQYNGANYQFAFQSVSTAVVPEPGQVAASLLLLAGIGGYVFVKRRRVAKPALAQTAA